MKTLTTFRTKRNWSPVIKISENKWACIDRNSGGIYRYCENESELEIVGPYEIDFDPFKEIERTKKIADNYLNEKVNYSNQLFAVNKKISFIGEVLGQKDIYSHCEKLHAAKLAEAEKQRKASIVLAAKYHGLTVKEYENFLGIIKAKNFTTSHSIGCEVVVKLEDRIIYSSDNREQYSGRAKKYTPAHGHVCVKFTKKEAKKIQLIGGVMTILGKKIDNHIQEASVILIEGGKYETHLTRSTEYITAGYHGKTIEDCKRWRREQAVILKAKRKGLSEIEAKKELAKYKFVGLAHSLKVGNCEHGSKEFARQHGLNPAYGYNLGYLLSLAPNNSYLQRML